MNDKYVGYEDAIKSSHAYKAIEKEQLVVQQVHDDWKERGFPYYPTDENWRNHIYKQLVSFKRDTLVDRRIKVIGQSAHGLKPCMVFYGTRLGNQVW